MIKDPGSQVFKLKSSPRCFNEESCVTVPDAEGYVMVLQPEEPKISLSGIDHFARSAAEFESQEGVTLFPELRIVSTITREVEADTESEAAEGADDDPTGKRNAYTPTLTPDDVKYIEFLLQHYLICNLSRAPPEAVRYRCICCLG